MVGFKEKEPSENPKEAEKVVDHQGNVVAQILGNGNESQSGQGPTAIPTFAAGTDFELSAHISTCSIESPTNFENHGLSPVPVSTYVQDAGRAGGFGRGSTRDSTHHDSNLRNLPTPENPKGYFNGKLESNTRVPISKCDEPSSLDSEVATLSQNHKHSAPPPDEITSSQRPLPKYSILRERDETEATISRGSRPHKDEYQHTFTHPTTSMDTSQDLENIQNTACTKTMTGKVGEMH